MIFDLIIGTGVATSAAPVNTVAPVISGNTTAGSTLTCTTGTWTSSDTPTYTYQWQRTGADIAGATNGVYVVQTVDEAKDITCVVTATNTGGSGSATSNTILIPSLIPVNLVPPVISGNTSVGSTLTLTSIGTWTGQQPISYYYMWQRNGGNTTNETNTYVIQAADIGVSIRCRVSAWNSFGTTVAAFSNAIVGTA